jgi:hypothetical protein
LQGSHGRMSGRSNRQCRRLSVIEPNDNEQLSDRLSRNSHGLPSNADPIPTCRRSVAIFDARLIVFRKHQAAVGASCGHVPSINRCDMSASDFGEAKRDSESSRERSMLNFCRTVLSFKPTSCSLSSRIGFANCLNFWSLRS